MALIRTTVSQIKSTAAQLRDYNGQFKTQVARLEGSEQSLNAMWEGQANDAFHGAFEHDKEYMTRFYELINKYCEALEQIAQQYAAAEEINTDTASRRTI